MIYDEIVFNNPKNNQIRATANENYILIQTAETEIIVLGSLESRIASFVSQLEKIPGNYVVDFDSFNEDKVVCLSENGYLSCYKLANECSSMTTVKNINLNEGEVACSISTNSKFNKICVGSLTSQNSKSYFSYIRVFEYDFIDNFFALKYDFKLDSVSPIKDLKIKLKESILFERQLLKGEPVFVVSTVKEKGDTEMDFYVLNDQNLKNLSRLTFSEEISQFMVVEKGLWVLKQNGSLNFFQ